jgi:hypothetical protein
MKDLTFKQALTLLLSLAVSTSIAGIYINEYSTNPVWLIVGILIFSSNIIMLHAKSEIEILRKGIHWSISFKRVGIILVFSTALSFFIIPEVGIERLKIIGYLALFVSSIFLLEFNLLYNWFKGRRNEDLLYLGREAALDRLFFHSPLLLLIFAISIFITSTILLYKNLLL